MLNLKTTVDTLPCFIDDKNITLFTKHSVFSESEIRSRYEILMENYSKTVHIEALTMIDIVRKEIIPSVLSYQGQLADLENSKRALNSDLSSKLE